MNLRLKAVCLSVLLPVISALTSSCSTTPPPAAVEPVVVPVGVLLPLTGDLAKSGQSELAALTLAADEINASFEKKGNPLRLELVTEDTATQPEIALEGIQRLTDAGVRTVIGPDSSEAVFRVLPWANWFNVLIISPASTAPTLAIEDDNLFRMMPDDSHQAKAVAHKMWIDGKRIIVPVYRDDQYASDLITAVKVNITMLGGTMVKGVRYGPETKNFRRVASRLKKEVERASQQYGTSALAVYVVGFEEAAILCRAARKESSLTAVSWYGGESLALNQDMTADKDVGPFVADRLFTCPQYFAEGPKSESVRSIIEEKQGHVIEAYTLAAYDALWLTAGMYQRAGPEAGIADLKAALLKEAASYTGATGSTEMNAAGDRKRGSYHFWQVQDVDGHPTWVNIYSYSE